MRHANNLLLLGFGLAVLLPLNALAGGFSRADGTSSYLGSAGAGHTTDRTATAAFSNPAGLTGIGSAQLALGAVTAYDELTFHDDGSDEVAGLPRERRRNGVDYGVGLNGGPSLFFAKPLSDRLSFGAALVSPYGGSSEFGNDWIGGYFTEDVELFTLQVSASLGYRLNDQWSIGAALGAQYAQWELKTDLAPVPFGPVNPGTIPPDHPMYQELLPPGSEQKIKIDDVQPYWSLGVMWQPGASTLFGVHYVPEIRHGLTGSSDISAPIPDMTVVGSYDASMKMSTPSSLTLGIRQQLSPRWTVLADIAHVGWSAWDESRVKLQGGPTVIVDRGWQDAMSYSLGFNFLATDRTLLKFGAGYDESPVASARRKIDPPMDTQVTWALGLEHALTSRVSLALSYQHLDMGDIRVEQEVFPGHVIRGHSDATSQQLQGTITVRFD
ncbi:MAG: outer membrane protein transport protein [Woeseiaceae bacterium]|nr:outer membrane protein transport protein [Woeseiaceae bacterium]